jgi:hypothetical protein
VGGLSTKFALIFGDIRYVNFPYCIVGFRLVLLQDREAVDILRWKFTVLKKSRKGNLI